jgi:short-subunit dehydrogenase
MKTYKKNIAITGASKGIGKAIAHRFAAAGYDIAAIARNTEGLQELSTDLNNQYPGVEVLSISADLANKTAAHEIARQIGERWPALHVLVNNAGLYLEGQVLTEPSHHLEQMLAVNLLAPYYLCRELTPRLTPNGHIINICSVASRDANERNGSYAITKHGLLALNKALRQELMEDGKRVTAILPGPTWTSSWEGAPIPEARLMPPEDVAEAVWNAVQMSERTVVEEIVIRPQRGDL